MDFAASEAQRAIAEVATQVLGQAGAWQPPGPDQDYDRARWTELGQAGLLGLALPQWLGGDGLGVMDTAVVLTEAGRQAAAVPALATLAMGVLPVVRWGDQDTQRALLAEVATGKVVLTAAIREPSEPMPAAPATIARLGNGSGTVSGVKIGVPYGAEADWLLLTASIAGGGTAIVVVDPADSGVTTFRAQNSAGSPECVLRLDDAPVRLVLGDREGAAVADLHALTVAGACCVADGALAAALALTASHVAAREQFGRPLAAFQAVAQRIADIQIVSRTSHLAALAACWRLEANGEAGDDPEVAAYWLAEQVPIALRDCHHLHGGTGMDISYPLHRYSSLVKDLVRLVGGAGYRLDRLSALMGG